MKGASQMNIRPITLAASVAVLLSAWGGDFAVTAMTPPATGYPSNDDNTRNWAVGDSGAAGYLHTDTLGC